MPEAKQAGVTLLEKYSNQVTLSLQLSEKETNTFQQGCRGWDTSCICYQNQSIPSRACHAGSGSQAVTAFQGCGSMMELGEAEKHLLARGGSHTLQLIPSLEKM